MTSSRRLEPAALFTVAFTTVNVAGSNKVLFTGGYQDTRGVLGRAKELWR